MSQDSTSEELPFDNVRDFLSALRKSNDLWCDGGRWDIDWIFRGHSCACWELTPASWRESYRQSVNFKETYTLVETVEESVLNRWLLGVTASANNDEQRRRIRLMLAQMRCEDLDVNAFVKIAHRVGLRVPGESDFRDDIFRPSSKIRRLATVAMAQHHGIPTDLLDFTYNPLYAAYFAASTDTNCDKCDRLCVWAVDPTRVMPRHTWQVLRVDPMEIDYLRAQDGLFLYCPGAFKFYVGNGHWPKLERCLPYYGIKKLTLPKSLRYELLRLLWIEDVSQAHLMPTHDNVTQSLKHMRKTIGAANPDWADLLDGSFLEGRSEN